MAKVFIYSNFRVSHDRGKGVPCSTSNLNSSKHLNSTREHHEELFKMADPPFLLAALTESFVFRIVGTISFLQRWFFFIGGSLITGYIFYNSWFLLLFLSACVKTELSGSLPTASSLTQPSARVLFTN